MIRGDYVLLRVPATDDADIIAAWENDSYVIKYLPYSYPVSRMAIEKRIAELRLHKDRIDFIIETEDNIPIGIASLSNIDWVSGTAKIDISIYAKQCWGRGYGYDTLKTLTNYGIRHINLHTIYAGILEGNERAVKCFQKCGYAIEGTLHQRVLKDEKYADIISMYISRDSQVEG